MSDQRQIPLGQTTDYVSVYTPELLFPIARAESRQSLGIEGGELPFFGVDLWTGYELSWLDNMGKPQVAIAEFQVPCASEFIVESKSFKLYLNSFNQTQFDSAEQVQGVLQADLSGAAGTEVSVVLMPLTEQQPQILGNPEGECLDGLPVTIEHYHPKPELLQLASSEVEETLYSHLLKTNCPVTGQPDWASVQISYKGRAIKREALLAYIISFREHQDFHEHCVERMFVDLVARCQPERLSVFARYTRRGGLDINPFRSTEQGARPEDRRLLRQ